MPEKLRGELPGILAWCVRGCLAWQRQGLGDPVAVKEATRTYRLESDVLGEFFSTRLLFESQERVTKKAVRGAYETWCREAGHEPVGAKRFAARLRENGVKEGRIRVGAQVFDGWAGVRLLSDDELRDDVGCREDVGVDSRSVSTCACARSDQPENAPYKSLRTTAEDDAEERAAIEGLS